MRSTSKKFIFKPNKSITIIDTSILFIIIYIRSVNFIKDTTPHTAPHAAHDTTPADAGTTTTTTTTTTTEIKSINYEELHNNARFMTYFKDTFIQYILNTINKIDPNSDIYNVVFAKDTPLERNWRKLEIYADYKSGRLKPSSAASTSKKLVEIYNRDVYKYFTNKLLPKIAIDYGIKIAYYEPLEADDIIYLMTKRIRELYPDTRINIITNDRDYLQILDIKTYIYKTNGTLLENDNTVSDSLFDKAIKILSGDVSDNIKPVYKGCGESVAYTLLKKLYLTKSDLAHASARKDEDMLEEQLLVRKQYLGEMFQHDLYQIPELSRKIYNKLSKIIQSKSEITAETISNNIDLNARLIDLDRIPTKYKEAFYKKYNLTISNRSSRIHRSA